MEKELTGGLFPLFLLLTREVSHGLTTGLVHLFRCTFAEANYRNKVPCGLRPIGPLLDAFGVGSDATTAKLSVANEGADKRLSRTTYRFVGHKVRALPEYPN